MLQIIKGTTQYIPECVEMLVHSELGLRYFSDKDSAKNAINEAAGTDTFLIALKENECVGFMYYLQNGAFHGFPYLHLIVVKESERGKGTGTEMIKSLEKILGNKKLFLVVASFNPNGKRFYKKNGFHQVGEIAGLYRPGITEYLMMKE